MISQSHKTLNIGVIDSGVDTTACSLSNAVVAFAHIDENGEHTNKGCHDPTGHGTFNCALLIGTSEDEPSPLTPGSKLYVSAAIEGQQLALKTLEALEWMLHQPIDMLLMPFGLKGGSPLFSKHIQTLVDRGVLPIAAIGNEGAGRFRAPGCYSNVLSVGASDTEGNVAPFSGSLNVKETTQCIKPDVAALGVQVESPYKKIGPQSGSSMAAAVLAGKAAQLWQQNPSLNNQEIAQLIASTATACQAGQEHRSRHGIYDHESALKQASDGMELSSPYLTPVLFERYIDPYLIGLSKQKGDKEIEFILMTESSVSMANIALAYQDLRVKKTYHHKEIAWVSAPIHVLREMIDDPQIKLIQSITVPFLSLG